MTPKCRKKGPRKQASKMRDLPESGAKQFIDSVRGFDRCNWCGNEARKNRKGLCRSCNDVRKQLDGAEKRAESRSDFMTEWELKVARAKKADCIYWGNDLKHILSGPVNGLRTEYRFAELAKKIANEKIMFHGMANTFDWTFTPEQRQVLAYLFWKIFRSEASHNRLNRALASVGRERRKT